MNKAFFINGGAGRVLCSIPALEAYAEKNDDFIIVAESWGEFYSCSKVLRDKAYPIHQKDLFENHLKDKEIVSPEPYRLNAYFNQKCNLVQAFDILINGLHDIPKTKKINLDLSKTEQITGHNLVNEVREVTKKNKVIVFQPFGSSVQVQGNFIFDTTGRSFEVNNIMKLIEELSKNYGIVLMSQIPIPGIEKYGVAFPQNVGLTTWAGIINASDFFLGCDSMGQHIAYALDKPTTVVIGSTFPENISYPDAKNFHIVDNGKEKRKYSPIRITMDECCDRNNEELMLLDDTKIKEVIKSIRDKIGISKVTNSSLNLSPATQIQNPSVLESSINGFQKQKSSSKKTIDKILELNNVQS